MIHIGHKFVKISEHISHKKCNRIYFNSLTEGTLVIVADIDSVQKNLFKTKYTVEKIMFKND